MHLPQRAKKSQRERSNMATFMRPERHATMREISLKSQVDIWLPRDWTIYRVENNCSIIFSGEGGQIIQQLSRKGVERWINGAGALFRVTPVVLFLLLCRMRFVCVAPDCTV